MIINIGKEHLRTVRYFTNDSSSYCYVPILKNAHSFGMHYFQKFVNYTEVSRLPQNKQFIIFLRDPIERWLSAIAEYFNWHVDVDGNLTGQRTVDNNLFTDKKRKPYIIPDEIMNMIFNAVRLDNHSDLQIRPLLGLNTDRCVFFDLRDPNFINKLNLFMWRRLKVREPYVYSVDNKFPIAILNSSENNQFKLSIIRQVKDVMKNNKQYFSNVLEYHQPDIYFIKNIKFYS